MKKLIVSAFIGMLALAPLASMADPLVETDFGSVNAESNGGNGGAIWLEGAEGNEDPLDGYIGVEGDADDQSVEIHCSDEGQWDDDLDEDGNPDRDGCDPQP